MQPEFMASENFVLQKFSENELKHLEKIIPHSLSAIEDFLGSDIGKVSNTYNGGKIEP